MENIPQDMKEALVLIDKLNMLQAAILKQMTERGSMTRDEYNILYALTLQEWREKHNLP